MKKLSTILIIIILAFSAIAQGNTISVKKKTPVKKKSLEGLYYSYPMMQEINTNGRITYKECQFYVLINLNKEVKIFYSSLSPEKIVKRYARKGFKMVEEFGNYSISENDLYFEVQTIQSKKSYYTKTYRYVAEIVDEKLFISYKAAYKQKTALDIYLYRYFQTK